MSILYNLWEHWNAGAIGPEMKQTLSNNTTGLTKEENSEKDLKSENEEIIIEDGMDIVRDVGAASMFANDPSYNDQTDFVHLGNGDENMTGGHSFDIKTLEDSLQYFHLVDRLEQLEESLERVRRYRNNQEAVKVHNSIIQRLDKDMLKLSSEIHPDKVQSRNGSEDELLRAHKLQTALNATRKAMTILNKRFLEDIDIDHKYGFYTKLDISSLGNEDEIEDHVFEVLFKICLVSEIKQRHIIGEIRKFLTESQSCIASYIQGNLQDFDKHLSSAVYHLKQCIRGYEKLLRELRKVEEECIAEKLNNISSLIRRMKNNCWNQHNILHYLSERTDSCLKGTFGIFGCQEKMDEYFVLPFVYYINILLMCDAFKKRDSKGKSEKIKLIYDPIFNEQTVSLSAPYYLTSYYGGSKRHENQVKRVLGQESIDSNSVKKKFLDFLLKVNDDLKVIYKVEEYSASGSNKHIAEELKKCKEMMSEFEQKREDLASDIADIEKDTKEMNQQIDKIISDQEESHKRCEAHLKNNSGFQTKFEHLLTNIKDLNKHSEKIQGMREECLKEYEASVAKHSEIQAIFASTSKNAECVDQEMDKTMSEHEEHRKQWETSLAENSNIQSRFAYTQEDAEMEYQESYKAMSEQERRKIYEACIAKNSELQERFSNIMKNTELIKHPEN